MAVTTTIPEGADLKQLVRRICPELPEPAVAFYTSHLDDSTKVMVGWTSKKGERHTHELMSAPHTRGVREGSLSEDDINAFRVKVKMSLCL